ncbi:MAG: hypothetical protein H7061_06120 [Bdellovibrionaceae bacterium]|nr:hypothetical protein [Bdellovibrio sp.]
MTSLASAELKSPQILHFAFDPKKRAASCSEPIWKDRIDRWYQLDETSFALCDAIASWQEGHKLKSFDEMVFLSLNGSNLADAEFVATRPASPSKFVYTLSNIGPSVASHLLKWAGPVFCYCPASDAEHAFALKLAIQTAYAKLDRDGVKTLILAAIPRLNEKGYRDVYGYFIS